MNGWWMVGMAVVILLLLGLLALKRRKARTGDSLQAIPVSSETAKAEQAGPNEQAPTGSDTQEQVDSDDQPAAERTSAPPAPLPQTEQEAPCEKTDVAVDQDAIPTRPDTTVRPPKQPEAREAAPPEESEVIDLSPAAYAVQLNTQEERIRTRLDQAVLAGDEQLQEQLRKKLVRVNQRLALLPDSHAMTLACYRQVLELLPKLAEADDAEQLQRAAAALRAGDPTPAEAMLVRAGEKTHPAAAQAAWLGGRLAECRSDLEQAMRQYRTAVQQDAANPIYLREAGRTARELYNYQEALPLLERFVQIVGEQKADDPVAMALAQRELAYTHVLSGHYQQAGPLYKTSMTVLARELGPEDLEVAIGWQQIGEYQETLGEYDKAIGLYQRALTIQEKKLGNEHPALGAVLEKLAALCMELEREEEAAPLYERLVRIREQTLSPTHPQLAISLNYLAEAYRLRGQYAQAEGCYRKALTICEQVHGGQHPRVAAILQELAKLCASQQRPEEARVLKERAAVIFQRSVEEAERVSGAQTLTLDL